MDWTKRGEYLAKHGLTVTQVSEALTDPDAVVFDPDYNSRTGVRCSHHWLFAFSGLSHDGHHVRHGRRYARCECMEVE